MDLAHLAFHARLSPFDLAALLDIAGKPAPFNLRPDTPPARVKADAEQAAARLAAAGLTEGGADAQPNVAGSAMAEVLLSPRLVFEISVWTATQRGSLSVAFPASPAAGAGVIVNRQDGEYLLGGFVDDRAITELVSPFLASLPEKSAGAFEAVLTIEQSAVLAALVDCARAQTPPDRAISARRVTEWLEIWWGASGPEHLCGQVFSLALQADPPASDTIGRVLGEFAAAGLLRESGDGRYRLMPLLAHLADMLAAVECGLDWQRVSIGAGDAPVGRIVRFLASAGGGLSLELADADRIVFRTLGRREAATFLAGELSTRIVQDRPAPEIPAAAQQTGAIRQNRFCTRCGQPVEPAWKFCSVCGAPTAKGTGQ
ncbi:MAG: zinc ribbon domain-containing protein [Notoacmeibacter sp.]|nr:zinc ribbon domain-containing protein [Notoacmeibacter sp.]